MADPIKPKGVNNAATQMRIIELDQVLDSNISLSQVFGIDFPSQTLKITWQQMVENLAAQTATKGAIFEFTYPIGTVYQSTTGTDPATLFGFGVWNRISGGRALVGEGSTTDDRGEALTFTLGDEGGEFKHVITVPESAAHTHTLNSNVGVLIGDTSESQGAIQAYSSQAVGMSSIGGNAPHNNTQPYKVISIWERTA